MTSLRGRRDGQQHRRAHHRRGYHGRPGDHRRFGFNPRIEATTKPEMIQRLRHAIEAADACVSQLAETLIKGKVRSLLRRRLREQVAKSL